MTLSSTSIRTRLIQNLADHDVFAVTVHSDLVQVSLVGSGEIVLEVEGNYTQREVARAFGLDHDLIHVSGLGPSAGLDL